MVDELGQIYRTLARIPIESEQHSSSNHSASKLLTKNDDSTFRKAPREVTPLICQRITHSHFLEFSGKETSNAEIKNHAHNISKLNNRTNCQGRLRQEAPQDHGEGGCAY